MPLNILIFRPAPYGTSFGHLKQNIFLCGSCPKLRYVPLKTNLLYALWSSRHAVSSGGGFGLLPEDAEKVI